MHEKLSLVTRGADGSSVSHRSNTRARRTRRFLALCAGVALLGTASAFAVTAASAETGGGELGALTNLNSSDTPFEPSSTPKASGGASLVPGTEPETATSPDADAATTLAPEDEPVNGTTRQLQLQRAQLVSQRSSLQQRLLDTEASRRAAEQRRDTALTAIATRLVTLFEGGEDVRVQALMAVRDQQDPELRATQLASLPAADRALIATYDAHDAEVDAITKSSDRLRLQVLTIGTKVAAIDAVIAERTGPTEAELARERGDRYSIDANYVFATGPIPGIGYWGAMNGGSMLTGWMGYASAAVGGVGCTSPDPSLSATGSVESGEASWYGPGFQGNNTANGERFDTGALTAAHKTLPFGTIVRVTSSATGRCAFVRINDRGPYIDGRVIDLSRAAADAIGMESVAPVQLEVYAAS